MSCCGGEDISPLLSDKWRGRGEAAEGEWAHVSMYIIRRLMLFESGNAVKQAEGEMNASR